MKPSEFDDLVRKKFAEFERQHGRVPTLPELAASLGVDKRLLERKLKRALALIGTDAKIEGTSAFKATLRQVMSKGLLNSEMPEKEDLQLLLLKARQSNVRSATMNWDMASLQMELTVVLSDTKNKPQWFLRSRFEYSNEDFRLVSVVEADVDELEKYIGPGLLMLSRPDEQEPVVQKDNVVQFKRPE
ncbi:MAG: hypothetical protein C0469_00850 [Cyanobacteria bacterium DS2.3.42]|nr:hypothetical protein [Cyanobacteria bacterium DS2.3.42]